MPRHCVSLCLRFRAVLVHVASPWLHRLVDLVLVHGYGFPRFRGGPLFHADQIGIAAIHEQLKELEARDPVVWKVAPLIEKLAADGQGFLDQDA